MQTTRLGTIFPLRLYIMTISSTAKKTRPPPKGGGKHKNKITSARHKEQRPGLCPVSVPYSEPLADEVKIPGLNTSECNRADCTIHKECSLGAECFQDIAHFHRAHNKDGYAKRKAEQAAKAAAALAASLPRPLKPPLGADPAVVKKCRYSRCLYSSLECPDMSCHAHSTSSANKKHSAKFLAQGAINEIKNCMHVQSLATRDASAEEKKDLVIATLTKEATQAAGLMSEEDSKDFTLTITKGLEDLKSDAMAEKSRIGKPPTRQVQSSQQLSVPTKEDNTKPKSKDYPALAGDAVTAINVIKPEESKDEPVRDEDEELPSTICLSPSALYKPDSRPKTTEVIIFTNETRSSTSATPGIFYNVKSFLSRTPLVIKDEVRYRNRGSPITLSETYLSTASESEGLRWFWQTAGLGTTLSTDHLHDLILGRYNSARAATVYPELVTHVLTNEKLACRQVLENGVVSVLTTLTYTKLLSTHESYPQCALDQQVLLDTSTHISNQLLIRGLMKDCQKAINTTTTSTPTVLFLKGARLTNASPLAPLSKSAQSKLRAPIIIGTTGLSL